MMKTIKTLLMITLILSLFSCANDISDNTENPSASTPSADGKTYIVVDLDSDSSSRTILPATSNTYKNKLTNITLKGKISGSDDNPVTLAHSDTYAKFSGRIPIAAGEWDFTITAEIDGVPFTASKTQTINSGTLNYLGFTLQADSTVTYGGLKITTNFTGDANKVVVKLLDQEKQSISTIPDQEIDAFESSGSNYSFTYERPITDDTKRLEDGTYYIIFSFYKVDDNNTSIVAPLNTYRSYVRIAKGVTTTATITIDLDEVYTITYNYWYNETSGFTADELEGLTFSGGTVLPEFYSRRSENFTLPTPSITGYTFDHWELNGQTITQITKGTTGDLEIDAFFTSQGGGGGNGGNGHTPNLDDFSLVSGAIISTDLANSGFSNCSSEPITIRDLYVCTHEVTQAEYTEYCTYGGTAPNDEDDVDTYPVYNVSWYDAIVYCNLRSLDETLIPVYSINNKTNPAQWPGKGESDGKYCGPNDTNSDWEWVNSYPSYDSIVVNNDANGYRLPTAIEWEYFARGGNGLPTEVASLVNSGCSAEDLKEYAHVASWDETRVDTDNVYPIMEKNANTLGLYDLCGNVKEICFDVQADGDFRTTFDGYVIKNGQGSIESYTRDSSTGFRVVRNVHNSVDFGTGVKWATTNVGAETIADYGAYYAWGETETRYNEVYRSNKVISWKTGYTNGYSWTGYEDGTDGADFTKYTNVSGNNVLSSTDDVATQKRGGKWRMPTPEECQALLDACCMIYTEDYNGSKIPGVILYKAKDPDDAGKNTIKYSSNPAVATYSYSDTHIFFPAAGYFTSATGTDCGLNSFKSDVLIWTNTIWENYTTGDTARMVPLKSDAGYTDSIDDAPRYYGFSVRPVYIGD